MIIAMISNRSIFATSHMKIQLMLHSTSTAFTKQTRENSPDWFKEHTINSNRTAVQKRHNGAIHL